MSRAEVSTSPGSVVTPVLCSSCLCSPTSSWYLNRFCSFYLLCMWDQPFNNTYLSLVGWNRGYLSRSTTCSKWRLDAIWWFEKQNILLLDRIPLLNVLVAMLLKYKWCLLNGKTCQTTLMSVSLSLCTNLMYFLSILRIFKIAEILKTIFLFFNRK